MTNLPQMLKDAENENQEPTKEKQDIYFCNNPTCKKLGVKLKCSRCKTVAYCNRDCQVTPILTFL
jgi:hypothetical protein